jgi:2-polyprenyl-6-methoxyphenol hydroxylase-like FAD-dependent oxidoreductase
MKVLIAGSGIAGLATAIALRQAGLEVQVFERSRELREIGAGLMIWPNGARSLQALGVEVDALTVREVSMRTWRGRSLSSYPLAPIAERHGFETSFVHRADLQAALARRFGPEGLCLDAEVSGFEQDEHGVRVAIRDGSEVDADLLVGADGLRSSVRRKLLRDGDPVYLGSTIWRGTVRANGLPIPQGSGINWIGPGAEFLAFQMRGDRIYWAGVTKEPRGDQAGQGHHKADLMERFGKWSEPVPDFIEATDESTILRNDMYDRPPARRWSSGRVTLVGDAAHPMTPNAGQGACQALEDATALGDSLRQTSDPVAACALYERRRLRRANWVVSLSRQATRGVQIEGRLLCAIRDNIGFLVARLAYLSTLDRILTPEGSAEPS